MGRYSQFENFFKDLKLMPVGFYAGNLPTFIKLKYYLF